MRFSGIDSTLICILSLLGYPIRCSKISKLIDLPNAFDTTFSGDQYGLILSYKSQSEARERFITELKGQTEVLCYHFAGFNYLEFKCFSFDCNHKTYSTPTIVCPTSYEEFALFTFFRKGDFFQLLVNEPIAGQIGNQYLRLLFQFMSQQWQNFHPVSIITDFAANLAEKWPNKIHFLCYGEAEHVLGSTFCYELGSMFRKNEQVNIFMVEGRQFLSQLTMQYGLRIDVNSLLPIFGYWHINTTKFANKQDFHLVQYLSNNNVNNVHLFSKMLFMKNPVTMRPTGEIPEIGEMPAPIIYCIHDSRAEILANELANQLAVALKGYAFVVIVDKDKIKRKILIETLGMSNHELGRVDILLKFRPNSGGDVKEFDQKVVDLKPADSIDLVLSWYRRTFDTSKLLDLVYEKKMKSDAVEKEYGRWYINDDEVEQILEDLDNSSNDENVTLAILSELNIATWLSAKHIAMVLFWTNVDTPGRASFYIFKQAALTLNDMGYDDNKIGLASIACHDWPDLCKFTSRSVNPEIRIYKFGKFFGTFDGILDQYEIADTALLLLSEPLQLINNISDLQQNIRLSKGYLDTFVIGILESSDDSLMTIFQQTARLLQGRYVFRWITKTTASNDIAEYREGNLAIVRLVPEPHFYSLNEPITSVDSIRNYVENSWIRNKLEMTPSNFPSFRRSFDHLFLVLSPIGIRSNLYESLRLRFKISLDRTTLAVLDSKVYQNFATEILKMLDLYLTDHEYFGYFNLDQHNVIRPEIFCKNCTGNETSEQMSDLQEKAELLIQKIYRMTQERTEFNKRSERVEL